jgi:hypothetical protein
MELTNESDIYQPQMTNDGNYIDYLPTTGVFRDGLRCPCRNVEHVFYKRSSFSTHLTTNIHHDWLSNLNKNKMNYYAQCEKLKALTASQKIIISKLQKDNDTKSQTINYLTNQLMVRDQDKDNVDFLTFD